MATITTILSTDKIGDSRADLNTNFSNLNAEVVANNAKVSCTTANVTAAGAVMDSEVNNLSGVKTLTVPDSTTITAAAATVLDDTTVGAMVNTLGGATSTGTGGLVRATSPTLVTPALGTPSALTLTNATGLPLTTGVTGVLPIANMATGTPDGTKFVRDDGTLATPAGSGDVVGPGSSVDGRLALFDSTTGKLLKQSTTIADDGSGNLIGVTSLAVTGGATTNSIGINGATSGTVTLAVPAVAGTNTFTIPAATDQAVGRATTDELTNKTITQPALTLAQGTAPTPTAEGLVEWDTDDNAIKVGDGAGTQTFSNDASNATTYAAASHAHAAADVTSGTFADARIAESNVTQHQAALSITESQISDLSHTDATKVPLAGGTMSGLLQFSGTTHAGIRCISLTTTERDALTPVAGDVIYNETAAQHEGYNGSTWDNLSAGAAGGNAWSDAVNADIVPDADGTRDLGSAANRFAELHVDTFEINGSTTITGLTGLDASAVSGTAGASGNLAMWNADGDAVDASIVAANVKTTRTGVFREVYINAGAMIPRTTNGAAAATVELATNDIMFDSMDFDATTEEGVGFWMTLPSEWDASTVKFKAHWTAASGTGTVKWDFSAIAYADDDALDATLGTEQGTTDTLITANDMHISPATAALTIGGTPAAGEPIYVQVARDVATDTLGVDARLLGVVCQYAESSTEPSIF